MKSSGKTIPVSSLMKNFFPEASADFPCRMLLPKKLEGLVCSTLEKCIPGMCEALCLISSTIKNKK